MNTRHLIIILALAALPVCVNAQSMVVGSPVMLNTADQVKSTAKNGGFLSRMAEAAMNSREMKMVNMGDALGKKLAQKHKAAQEVSQKQANKKQVIEKEHNISFERKEYIDSFINGKEYKTLARLIRTKFFNKEETNYILTTVAIKDGIKITSFGTEEVAEAVLSFASKIDPLYEKALLIKRQIHSPRVGM